MSGDAAVVDPIIKNPTKDRMNGALTFIGSNYVHKFDNITFAIHGAGKKNNNAKQSWNWQLGGNDMMGNRTFFKLRHMEEDPTQIRERLYADVLNAMGNYGNDANMVRLFINGQGFGTFNMLDDITQYSYINAKFYGGKAQNPPGPLYDGMGGADFLYHPGNLDGYSSFAPAVGSPEGYQGLDPLCKAFNETNTADNNAVATFGNMFDIDHFLRFMVMEYLSGHWDGYWMGQTNNGAYREPAADGKWYFLDQDFDGTFGVNLAAPEGMAFTSVSYKEFPARYPGGILANGLLQNPDLKATFEKYLVDTVKVLYNNVTLTNRVLALHDFLLPDLTWDRSIVQQSPGINFGWNLGQVTENLWTGVSAPNQNGGGAAWGLVQWIAERSAAVAKEFNIQITTTPVGPPGSTASNGTVTPGGNKPPAPAASNSAGSTTAQSKADSAAAARHVVPTVGALAIAACVAALL